VSVAVTLMQPEHPLSNINACCSLSLQKANSENSKYNLDRAAIPARLTYHEMHEAQNCACQRINIHYLRNT